MLNLFIEHDARALAQLTGAAAAPDYDSIILKHGDASTVLAASHLGNPLRESWMIDAHTPARRIVAWSGTLADGLFEADPRTWMRQGREAFARFCDEIEPQLAMHNRTLCFHPHARHVLNDVPSCLDFLRQRADSNVFEIALAPASMLEPSMLSEIDDHLRRQFEALGSVCAMVMLSDARVVDDGQGESRCESVLLGEGVLPRDTLLRLLAECVPATTPIVIRGRAIDRQLEWLGCQAPGERVSSSHP